MKQKILVTGKDGQLGWELNQIANAYASEFDFKFCGRSELDLMNLGEIETLIHSYEPQYVINCAAYTAVDKAETEEQTAFAINAYAPQAIAKACQKINCKLIHISTDYVFDGEKKQPYLPSDKTNPLNIYGASKAKGEEYIAASGCSAIIIRTSWVYSSHGKNFVKTMLKLMTEREELNVVYDQIGCPTYAADLAEAIMSTITSRKHLNSNFFNVYHYSNTGNISWYDFAVAIKSKASKTCKVNPIPSSMYPTPAKRSSYSTMNCDDIQRDFNVEIKDWKESLEKAIRLIQVNQ